MNIKKIIFAISIFWGLQIFFPIKIFAAFCCQYDHYSEVVPDATMCTGNLVALSICGVYSEENNGTPIGSFETISSNIPVPTNIDEAGLNLENIVSTIVGFLIILAGLWFFIIFITGGLSYISAGGESGKIEEARKKMTNGVIGVIIVVAAYSVIFIVGKVLGLDILNPAKIIKDLGPGGN